MSPVQVSFEIKPLTHKSKKGIPYERDSVIIAQIEELSRLSEEVLYRRIMVQQEDQYDSIKSEVLVFLFRNTRDVAFRKMIFDTLSHRIRRMSMQFRRKFNHPDQVFPDFLGDLLKDLLIRLSAENDAADFAEARFGKWTKGYALNMLRKYQTQRDRDDDSDSIDVTPDDNNSTLPPTLPAGGISPEERHLVGEALKQIKNPDHRNAWLCRVVDGYQIESNDPNEPTLAKMFGVSGRTIRNWLTQAERDLEVWRGGLVKAL